ncbi:dUTP diphosphatase [Spirochaeta africana]|uniref:Deoxyuridine 5'-triphosphate nucleotidohydrolase n=1 Tax=Spirochaeta africana (strain ATCC 700263 / DSM 8902 / Z-7692) TaxID=889378 RepID=H9UJA0_SPIAZ|nr:dUTP diphosphatase [Spirochaeta africana]AFG37593.1 deoxyuridine 5'-triphosphate nucleotidohydrolase Dut [Spirochaeta africana DSM 8902]
MSDTVLISSSPQYIPQYVPEYQSSGAVGVDLRADLQQPLELRPLERCLVGTGLRIALPDNLEAQVRPRSGLASRAGITVINAPGTIDPDYRGEIRVPIINLSNTAVTVSPGDRIAQMVIAPFVQARFHQVTTANLPRTDRGEGGFGSTGVH